MRAWGREMWTKDLVFEVLIRQYMGEGWIEPMRDIMGRVPGPADTKGFYEKVSLMYNGWVHMNKNIRKKAGL